MKTGFDALKKTQEAERAHNKDIYEKLRAIIQSLQYKYQQLEE